MKSVKEGKEAEVRPGVLECVEVQTHRTSEQLTTSQVKALESSQELITHPAK